MAAHQFQYVVLLRADRLRADLFVIADDDDFLATQQYVDGEQIALAAFIKDDDIEFFNSMQKLMATAQSDASDKVEIPSQTKGLELGSQAFG